MANKIYKNILLASLATSFLAGPAIADNKEKLIPSFKKHIYTIGAEAQNYTYKEPGLMQDKGNLYGLFGSYSYYFKPDTFLTGEYRWTRGNADYKSVNTGTMKKIPSYVFEFRFLYNQIFKVSPKLNLTPFTGYGYRYKDDDSRGFSSTGHYGYFRSSKYHYIPLGLSSEYDLDKDMSISAKGEYDIFLKGTQKSYMFGYVDKHKQNKGYGMRGEILLNKKMSDYIISIGPFMNYWNIKDSKKNYYPSLGINTWEPKNNTKEIGIKLKVTGW